MTRLCLECSTVFGGKSSQKYCSELCRNNAYRSANQTLCIGYFSTKSKCPDASLTGSDTKRCQPCKSTELYLSRYFRSPKGLHVYNAILNAGTVETFPDLDAIKAFNTLRLYRQNANGLENSRPRKLYEVCHRYPLGHADFVGLTTDANLFVGKRSLNRKAGNRDFPPLDDSPHLYIERKALKRRFKITKNDNRKSIMLKLLKHIGPSLAPYIRSLTPVIPKPVTGEIADFSTTAYNEVRVLADQIDRLVPDLQINTYLKHWLHGDPGFDGGDGATVIGVNDQNTVIHSSGVDILQEYFQSGNTDQCPVFDPDYAPDIALIEWSNRAAGFSPNIGRR